MKLLILGGGDSPEREVSLRSAKAVTAAARQAGFEVSEADPIDGLEILNTTPNSIIFPILHGKNGEDGVLQKELEARNMAFLGSGSQASATCFDKWQTRQKLTVVSLPMAKAGLVTKDSYKNNPLSAGPHVLKIVHGGSSIGTLIVRNPKQLNQTDIDEVFGMEKQAVLEQLIEGIEITVPVLDSQALPVIEIVPPVGGEFDYKNKYNGASAEICPPKNISAPLQKQAQALAEKAHQTIDCRHLSRVDMMLDRTGNLYVLEINTMPGLTDQSLYPKSAATAGLPMPQLVSKFAELVKRDYNL